MPDSDRRSYLRENLIAAVPLWLVIVLAAGYLGLFQAWPEGPPLAALAAIAVPVLLFAAGCRISPEFRRLVLSLDIRRVALFHTTRLIGAVFLVYHAQGLLPARFALPAGWGDITVALAAPLAVWALGTSTDWGRRLFVAWNYLGLLDFAVAVGMGAVAPLLLGPAGAGMAAIRQLPLVLIPAFAVPLLIMLHLTALLQIRNRAGENRSAAETASYAAAPLASE